METPLKQNGTTLMNRTGRLTHTHEPLMPFMISGDAYVG